MYPLIAMLVSLILLIILLHYRVKLGRAMFASALALALLLKLTPSLLWTQLVSEWHKDASFTQSTPYLFISLSALLLMVNVIGAAMQKAGISQRLGPAMQGLFRSRRLGLCAIPMIMGLLPTPGGIMLSAPMVRDLGDQIGIGRSRQAAINFFFRHQFESVWPLFPAVPLVQGIFAVSAFAVIGHNLVITVLALLGGAIGLLFFGMPAKNPKNDAPPRRFHHSLTDFLHALWPIALTAVLYAAFNVPPAIGITIGVFGLLILHRIPRKRWPTIFKAANEPDFVLLIGSALLFKLNFQAAGAIPQIKDFLVAVNLPPSVIIFTLPFVVAFLTGLTMPTVAITFPFLVAFIGKGVEAQMGLQTLAFSGLLCGLYLTPVHLCLALSASYFQAPLYKIILRLLIPIAFIAAAGIVSAIFL